jgi:hypothetical protein
VFYVNTPIGVLALVLAARLVPHTWSAGWRSAELDVLGSLLLGAGVLGVLVPLVEADSGGLSRLWWLWVLAALLLTAFGRREVRAMRRGRQPLLDPRLVRTPGYAAGSAIGLVYFIGFTGIWMVLALFFQDGLGYSPLRSGLSVTPFALGVATSAVIAGRLASRFGRWLSVVGLVATVSGLIGTALVLRNTSGDATTWATVGPLLVAGVGSGMVTSPNMTLTLANVPVRMGGAAGGAVQTAQRIGAAIGTATLATIYYHVLTHSDDDFSTAVSDSLLSATAFMLLALLMALADATRRDGGFPIAPGRSYSRGLRCTPCNNARGSRKASPLRQVLMSSSGGGHTWFRQGNQLGRFRPRLRPRRRPSRRSSRVRASRMRANRASRGCHATTRGPRSAPRRRCDDLAVGQVVHGDRTVGSSEHERAQPVA